MFQLIMPWKFGSFLPKITLLNLASTLLSRSGGPCDFFLFPKLKKDIKGTRFQDSEAIKTAVRAPSDPGGILLPGVRGSVAEEIGKVHPNQRKLL